ncbi:MAG: RecF/RecN/SMC terminal domain, partial [Pseudonocardiales bacterium]|nr:RecF/RecN/SMC terminal domain [Pseudonocardiales bacterium]
LQDSGAVCPTCQRPLSGHEREAAGRAHKQNLDVARQEIATARAEVTKVTAQLRTLRQLLGDVERLGDAPQPSADEVDIDAVELTLRDARAGLDRVNHEAQQRQGALGEITRTLATMAADEAAEAERFRSIRKEAAAQLTADLMRQTVTALMDERVTPIADEVSARWKQVFGERGTLRLTAKGAITMERDGHTIGFKHFSPGEQVVSMLALRFLTVAASTSSPFMLLDEPLECLDPPNRRLIASVIAGPDRPVGQMIVTTYEDALVRRIRETVPGTDVRVIN